jgi:eukaryotic-like serine/threonine-protein kinase
MGEDMKTDVITGRPRAIPAVLHTGQQIDRYVLTEPLGAGGMGVVWAALDRELNRTIAIKVVQTASLRDGEERLLREAQAMAMLSHPAVVPVFDVGSDGDQLFVAMELVDGDTLQRALGDKPRRWREVLAMFAQAGRGLAAAHDVGIVHRDFKPENVLVGRDGRVRVTDFGLARFADRTDYSETVEPGRSPETPDLTRTGAVMGTPRYMAPEQHRGEIASAASDQFSFCVALWEALYGSPPFLMDDPAHTPSDSALADAVIAGHLRPVPARSPVPRRLRRILARGLSVAPADRWPSMSALLDALEGVPRRRRRLAYGATAALSVAALVIAWPSGDLGAEEMCERARQPVGERWSIGRRAATMANVVASGESGAAIAARAIAERLDRYAQLLGDARVQACEAVHVRGEQSVDLLDRRMACLDRRLGELQATIDVISGVRAGELERLLDAVDRLPNATPCADAAMLLTYAPLPDEPVERQRLERLQNQVATAQAQARIGRYATAREQLTTLNRDPAIELYPPLASQARFAMGLLYELTGEHAVAESWFREAVIRAELGHADDLRGKALHELGNAQEMQGHAEVALQTAAQVHAIADRIGDISIEVDALTLEANAEARRGELARALELAQRALERAGQLDGDPKRAVMLNNVGSKLAMASRFREAEPYFRRALALNERDLGPEHPVLVATLNNVGNTLSALGRPTEALDVWRRALAILERIGQGDGEEAMVLRSNIPHALTNLGRFDDADAALRQGLVKLEAKLGHEHRLVRRALYNLGNNRLLANDPVSAEPWFRANLAHCEKNLGPKHLDIANARWGLAASLAQQNRPAEALPLLLAAYPIQLAQGGETSDDVAYTRFSLASVYLDLGRPADALVAAEAAQAYFANGSDVKERGEVQLLLARALHCLRRDPARSIALATQARADLIASGNANGKHVTIANQLIDQSPQLRCPARHP